MFEEHTRGTLIQFLQTVFIYLVVHIFNYGFNVFKL